MRWIALAIVVLMFPAPARAQEEGQPWVAARMLWDGDHDHGVPAPWTIGGGVALGIYTSHRLGMELTLDEPQAWTVPTGSRLLASHRDFGWTLALLVNTFSVPRAHASFIVGYAELTDSERYSTVDGSPVGSSLGPSAYSWSGLLVGIETAVALTRHLAIAPEIRVIEPMLADTPASGAVVRPGIAVRWIF